MRRILCYICKASFYINQNLSPIIIIVMSYTESHFENAILELLKDGLGYEYFYGPDIPRDHRSPLMEDVLEISLTQINSSLPTAAITEALHKLHNFEGGTPIQKNMCFTDWLQNGIEVNYYHGGEQKAGLVYLVDYETPANNKFSIANQWTIVEHSEKRPDIIIFINGLPLVVVELKSPSREQTDASEAYCQLRNYMHEIPSLFYYNAMCVISDQATTKVGTITADEGRYLEWKTVDGNYENTTHAAFDVLFEGMFEQSRFLDIIRNFICFSKDGDGVRKILAAYHQYYAVRKAVTSTDQAAKTDGKGGVFWHTQGSGKSLSMVFYAQLLQTAMDSPTIVVLTDRNDLDDQLYTQFSSCKDFLRQTPVQASSREHLRQLLSGRQANGIFFTTMQKFEEVDSALSERRNIVVMADEAHRGQYGFTEKIDPKTGKVSIGAARVIRDNLPNATYIGFTGTPLSLKDRSTREVFGDYIDIYDMTQSVADGATRPVYYESRVINLKLDKDILDQIDKKYEELAQITDAHLVEKSKQELGRLDSILGSPETIDSLCLDVIAHYEDRQYYLTGKAMIVAYSRPIAMKIYERILELRPQWEEKIKVVMTSDNRDPEEWHSVVGNKAYREELACKFKDNNDPMKIAIVVDMWLTGFDVPSLATMYVYKPMSGHNLMQAIARVNRVFKDKEGGLVVDYVGIASALKQAMSDYTRRDQANYGEMDIIKTALPKFIEKLDVCRDLMHGYDYSAFLNSASDLGRAKAISGGVDFLSSQDKADRKENFVKEALLLRQAMTLCHSRLNEQQRYEAGYFEAVRTLLMRVEGNGKLSFKELNAAINDLLKQSIHSEGVINLFSDIHEEFSIFDPKFLAEISQMKERNLAVEMLKKLIAEQISVYKRTNVVKSEKFSDMMMQSMSNYLKGLLTNEQVIEELMKMAQDIALAHKEGEEMGLSTEEMAFYDALTRPSAVKDFYDNDALVAITKELTDTLRKNKTIDWQKKEGARAGMRMIVKRLLKKYKYPPEGVEDAINTVMTQCEMWSDNN